MRNVPRRQVIVEFAGVLLAIAVGLFFYFRLHQAFGLLLAAVAIPGAVLNLFLAAGRNVALLIRQPVGIS